MKNSRISLQELWRLGCRGECLDDDDQARFGAMARSRFHTFQLGIEHARDHEDPGHIDGLVRGLARELHESPGLQPLWFQMDIAGSSVGQAVSLQLEKLASPTH